MAYDEELADRVRRALAEVDGVEERRMFGGLAFLVNGHMACGVERSRLMVRVGKEAYARTLEERHVAPMTFTGRELAGYVYVDAAGLSRPEQVAAWAQRGAAHTRTLPPKAEKTAAKKTATKRTAR
jgi:TfoX/Sxy family transcriptional regulator of competence genes